MIGMPYGPTLAEADDFWDLWTDGNPACVTEYFVRGFLLGLPKALKEDSWVEITETDSDDKVDE
jgi:hypothetical protein